MNQSYQYFFVVLPLLALMAFVVVVVFVFQLLVRKGRGGSAYPANRLGGPEVASLIAAISRMDLSSLDAMLTATRQASRWDDRVFILGLVADALPRVPRHVLDAWVAQQPTAPSALLIRGIHAIRWAWEARGTGVSSTVTKDGRELFHERLALAQSDLQAALQADPPDPAPCVFMLDVCRGFGLPADHTDAWFRAAIARDPDCFLAGRAMITYLHPKWHGSAETVTAFARGVAAQARPGSDLKGLPILAHLAVYEYLSVFQDAESQARAWINSPAVRQELESAIGASIGAPEHLPRSSTMILRNHTACYLYLVKDKARFKAEIMKIGNAFSEAPWQFLGRGSNAAEQAEDGYRTASKWAFSI